ncbi:MAG TPA: GNAT family N-acetyltransferase [Peptococcaceae bacterium]|nr:GNAT family N-acetyltransferase [Peptococcaceae bacterium]
MARNPIIRFGTPDDEDELMEIMYSYGMGLPGEIEEHLLLEEDHTVLGGCKVVCCGEGYYFLEVIGIKKERHKQGLGGLLLEKIVQKPWECCATGEIREVSQTAYTVATIARGEAVAFYRKYGFQPCEFEEIPEIYREQCNYCPEKESCQPVPMIYFGGQ